jgi:hypothetical protein
MTGTKPSLSRKIVLAIAVVLVLFYFSFSAALVEINKRYGQYMDQSIQELVAVLGPPHLKNDLMQASYWHDFGLPGVTLSVYTTEPTFSHSEERITYMQLIPFNTQRTFFRCPIASSTSLATYLIAPLQCDWLLKA